MVTYKGQSWRLSKRFSAFEELHNQMSKVIVKNALPPFPKKKLGKAAKDPLFLESRRLQLLSYMNSLIKNPTARDSKDMDLFLGLSKRRGDASDLPKDENSLANVPGGPAPLELFRQQNERVLSLNVVPTIDNVAHGGAKLDSSQPADAQNLQVETLPKVKRIPERFPLHRVAMEQDPEPLETLIPGLMDRIDELNEEKMTPLQLAALKGRPENVRILLRAKANVTLQDNKG